MHAVVVVWVVWILLVLAVTLTAVLLCPRWAAPAWWMAVRERVAPVIEISVGNLGRAPTAILVYLASAGAILLVGWPLGLLAHALQGQLDEPAFRWFEQRRLGWWSDVWLQLTKIGSPSITQQITVVAAVFFAFVWAIRRREWWFPLLALPLGYCLEKYTQIILQTVVHRGHPPTTLGTYPSGGCGRVLVVYGMVIFLTISWLWPRSRRMWVAGWGLLGCLVSIQAYARIYNLEHWVTDVIGGVVFGLLLITAMSTCLRVLGLPAPTALARASRGVVPQSRPRRHVGVRPSSVASRSSYDS